MKRCPWCHKNVEELVMIMYFTKHYSQTERVCPDCKRAWIKRLKKNR